MTEKIAMNYQILQKNSTLQEEERTSTPSSQDRLANLLISIVIPLFNEENSIKKVIERIPNHYHYEIIVIDDGSTDNSVMKIKEINSRIITIISHEKNKGYGAALQSGFRKANGDIIVTLDSDSQHKPEEIPNLIEPIIRNEADLVIGSRYLGSYNYKIPLFTKFGELIVKICLKQLYGQVVGNNQSGFRAFKRDLLTSLIEIDNNGMAFTTELLLKVMEKKRRVIEIPIILDSRIYGSSDVKLFKITLSILSCIIIYSLNRFTITRFVLKKIIPKLNTVLKIIIGQITNSS